MAKPLKLRISRVITSLQSCNSKDTSTLPEDPVPSFLHPYSTKLISTVDFPLTKQSSNTSSSAAAFKRHVSSAFLSAAGCGLTSRSGRPTKLSQPPRELVWLEDEKWCVVAREKIYISSDDNNNVDEVLALPPPPPQSSPSEKKKRRARKKKISSSRSFSTDESGGLFSNDEEEEETETETLVSSSRTFSNESSPISNLNRKPKPKRKPKKRAAKRGTPHRVSVSSSSSENETMAGRLSVFKKMIACSVEGKVKESFAVVKKSRDPHEDFKRSMMEMIVEKHMFDKDDLEQLLQCFLSLNSREYHGIIICAFSEIWEHLFNPNNNVIN